MPQTPPLIEKPKVSRARRLTQLLLWLVVIFLFLTLILFIGRCGCCDEGHSKTTEAQAQMNTLQVALSMYRLRNGTLPSTEEGLEALVRPPAKASFQKPLISPSGLLDPWGSAYQYREPSQDSSNVFDLWSFGPDKKNRTEDDISGFNESVTK